MLHGGSWAARDLEDLVGEEKRACFNGLLGSGEVGRACRGPYTIYLLYKHVLSANLCMLHRLIVDRLNQLII
jgi:hypothetical protein